MTDPVRPLYDFPYGPLKTDRHEIRLIQLKAKTHEPNQSDCALYVDLIHAERGHCQPYMALSYAWGRNNDQAPLRIRGRQYYINKRVDAALRQLQDKDSDVFIWIDQICINQQDDVEKGNQVQQMKEIYSEAETVVVWLGPAENGSDRLLKHLGRMGMLIWSGDHRRVFAPHQTKDAIEAIEPAFRFLCERDYWKRLWIMQEYTVARRLKIACGNVKIWDWQLQAVFVFINKLSINQQAGSEGGSDLDSIIRDMVRIYKTPAASFMEGVVTRRNRYWRQTDRDSDSLFQVLITTLVLEQDYNFPLATDPRDRIFSVLQLVKDTAEFSAFPNYTWTCARVYREAALTMLKQGHIDILAYCQFPRDSPDIPSWAPDWRMMIRSPCTGPPWVNDFSASGQTLSQQSVSSSSTGIVALQGIIIGSVKECESIWDPDWSKPLDHASAMEYLEHVRVMCEKSPTISQKSDREKGLVCLSIASCRRITENTSSAISADTHRGTLDGRRSLVPSAQVSRITKRPTTKLERVLWTLSPEGTHGPGDVYMEQLRFLHRRRPFISDAGYIGTIPSFAQPGDVLCIFFGGKVPYAIRPANDQSDAYTLIGEAFVYGLMDGEYLRDGYIAQSITLR